MGTTLRCSISSVDTRGWKAWVSSNSNSSLNLNHCVVTGCGYGHYAALQHLLGGHQGLEGLREFEFEFKFESML